MPSYGLIRCDRERQYLGVQVTANLRRLVTASQGVLTLIETGSSYDSIDSYRTLHALPPSGWSYSGIRYGFARRVLSGWRLEFMPDAVPLGRRPL